ncbi:DMT family transporter [Streptomyces sp. SP18CS02]|uniref:DMT family transporter n=1 Tax=Streptomyces sp. SP18CS02 TaxID=3002531 RepID=UPI002E76D5CE|nr:DMT family transporter [Streptomyces sp. SP18CS02]MEE1751921.1 DMT family transporter [Streptomyces sp. SP18CS02]
MHETAGPSPRRAAATRGMAALGAYAALSAGFDVYAGERVQQYSPMVLAALSFGCVIVVFLGWDLVTRGPAEVLRPVRARRRDVLALNVTTAVGWLTMLYALVRLEPAIVNVVGLAVGPVLTVLLEPVLRRGARPLRAETVVSFAITGFLAVLVWASLAGRSAVGGLDTGDAVIGLLLTLVSGIASTGNVIFSKRLSDAGFGPRAVMSVRFPVTLVISWGAVLLSGQAGELGAALPSAAVLAVLGVGLPLYLIQVGIRHTEPVTASLFSALSPPLAFLFQLTDARLSVAPLTLGCIVAITLLIGVGLLARHRHERRALSSPRAPAGPAYRQPVHPDREGARPL